MSEMLEPKMLKFDNGHWNEVGKVITTFQRANFPDINFVEDKYSKSFKGVVRGLHGDNWTWKLISCLYGKIFLQVVDGRRSSSNHGKLWKFLLSEENNFQVLVPPGFFNGHQAIVDDSIFFYKFSSYYSGIKNQLTLSPFEYGWPLEIAAVSDRDLDGKRLVDLDIENFRSGMC